jgi:hypothetical protein
MATTAPRPATRRAADDISYTDLYERWERGNWSATEIDFTQDKIDWEERMTDDQRRTAMWLFSLFFHGEDAVTDGLSPYIDAAPLEEQKYFIATQQVDEARHSVFFNRFINEVVGLGDGSIAGGMNATASQLSWGHKMIFQGLEDMCVALRADQSPHQFARAITLYHILIEASLAQPGQHVIEAFLEEEDLMPGFRAGIANVALDEQRHIAFGVKALADLYDADPKGTETAVLDVLRENGVFVTGVAMPPNWDESYFTAFNYSYDALGRDGITALESRLRAIGIDLHKVERSPLPVDLPLEERADRGRVLLQSNLVGPDRPASRDPYATEVMFDSIARAADVHVVPSGTVIEWAFTDAEPWQLSFDAGKCSAGRGTPRNASLKLVVSFDDWADIFAKRVDARKLLLTRRLRPKGNLRLFAKFGKIFP